MGSQEILMANVPSFAFSAAKWVGTAAGVSGAILIVLNVGMVVFGFALFLLSSVLWGVVGLVQREASLFVMQAVFTAVNLLGLWRWAI
jgi:hypothetical protein